MILMTVGLTVLAATLFYYWLRSRRVRFTVFKELGISGPEPNILLGNLIEMKDVGQHKKWQDWTKEYGPTYGYYEGPKPILVTKDVDMIRQIMIKNFSNFHSRKGSDKWVQRYVNAALWSNLPVVERSWWYIQDGQYLTVTADSYPPSAEIERSKIHHTGIPTPLREQNPFPMTDKYDDFVDMFTATQAQKWKRLRCISSPSFSTRRMREMSPLIANSIDQLIALFKKRSKNKEVFDIYGDFQRLTLTVIADVAFGIEINAISDPDTVFLHQARKLFEITEERTRPLISKILMPVAVVFPEWFHEIWHYVQPFFTIPRTFFIDSAKQILLKRMKTKSSRVDFVSLMLEARLEDGALSDTTMTAEDDDEKTGNSMAYNEANDVNNHNKMVNNQNNEVDNVTIIENNNNVTKMGTEVNYDIKENENGNGNNRTELHLNGDERTEKADSHKQSGGKQNGSKLSRVESIIGKDGRTLTMPEMQSQAALFLLAGYETTSTALAFLCYELAINPNIQHKLQEEVDYYYPDKNSELDYSAVQKLPYMDMALSETLRKYPIAAIALTRTATEDCEINGVSIRAGMIIQANMEAVHYDPEHWGPEDTHQFVPERFLPERKAVRHPCAFLAFGVGPRNCVGLRFAFLEAKLTLARILQNFTIERTEETPDKLPINTVALVAPSEGVWIKLTER